MELFQTNLKAELGFWSNHASYRGCLQRVDQNKCLTRPELGREWGLPWLWLFDLRPVVSCVEGCGQVPDGYFEIFYEKAMTMPMAIVEAVVWVDFDVYKWKINYFELEELRNLEKHLE